VGVPVLADFNGGTLPSTTINAWIAAIRFALPLFVRKANDQSISSNTTLQNDSDLFVPVAANASYVFDLLLLAINAGGSAAGDMKYAFTQPSGSSASYAQAAPHVNWPPAVATDFEAEWAGKSLDTGSPTATTAIGLTTTIFGVHIKGDLVVGANAGTFQLQWAQNSSNASASTVKAGSYMRLQQVA
jgi:hypothetical protein